MWNEQEKENADLSFREFANEGLENEKDRTGGENGRQDDFLLSDGEM